MSLLMDHLSSTINLTFYLIKLPFLEGDTVRYLFVIVRNKIFLRDGTFLQWSWQLSVLGAGWIDVKCVRGGRLGRENPQSKNH